MRRRGDRGHTAFEREGMMNRSILKALVAFPVLFAVAVGPAVGAEGIGAVVELVPRAFGAPPDQTPQLVAAGYDVVSGELLQTVAGASLRVRFIDDTDLRMGESSLVVLDNMIYDPQRGVGDFALTVAAGVARFISGKIDPDNVVIRTPTAVIAIRGTDFIVAVAQNGATRVAVLDGIVQVTPIGGLPSLVRRGQTAAIAPGAGSAVIEEGVNVPSDPGLGDLEADEGDTDSDSDSGDSGGTEDASEQPRFEQTVIPTLPPIKPNMPAPQPPHPTFSPQY